ncbi:MAG: hypothetical protein ACRDYE_03750 [Acidimicrobiales bacterium]
MDDATGRPGWEGSDPDRYSLLSVIVPVFNERSTVAELLRRVRNV